jgi:hypothetical protein
LSSFQTENCEDLFATLPVSCIIPDESRKKAHIRIFEAEK